MTPSSPEPITWTLADLRRDAADFMAREDDIFATRVGDFLSYLTSTYGEFVPGGKDSLHAA